ncbi:MAG: hypothetical protein AAF420_02060 [Pseudomonadota bacterium]
MRFSLGAIALVSCALLASCSEEEIFNALSDRTCTENGTIQFRNFTIENNMWNSVNTNGAAYSQCVAFTHLSATSWRIDWEWSWPLGLGNVKAYPQVYYGNKFGHDTGIATHLPDQIDSLRDYTLYLNYALGEASPNSTYSVSVQSWIHSSEVIAKENRLHGISVWLNQTPGFNPQVTFIQDITIGGAVYGFYRGPVETWEHFIFVRRTPVTETHLHWNPFVDYLRSISAVAGSSYLASLEFGAEVVEGDANFTVNGFSVAVD